jgi:hypothetical protein
MNSEDRNADLHYSQANYIIFYLRLLYTRQLYFYIYDVWAYGKFSFLHADTLLHACQCARRCVTVTWITV